jgi:hypothetical protein
MKYLFLLCISLVFAYSSAAAQVLNKFSFGLKSGVNISSYDIKYNDNLSHVGSLTSSGTITRFNVGAFINLSLIKQAGVIAEMIYINQGGHTENNITSSPEFTSVFRTYESEIKYLNFAILPYYFYEANTNIGPVFFAGPYLGFLTGARQYTTEGNLKKTELDLRDYLSSTDAGFIFGIQLKVKGFTAEGRYNFGLTNMIDNEKLNTDSEARNTTYSFLIGYQF